MNIKNIFKNILMFILGYILLIILISTLGIAISVIGLLIGFTIPYFLISILFLYITFINIFSFDFKIFRRSFLKPLVFICIVLTYSILSWYIFSIKEGHKQGLSFTSNNPHEYSDKYWYFLNRTHPLFPFTYNGSAYIDENHNLSIPDGYRSLARDKNRVGWHSIVSYKFYYFSFVIAIIFGLNTVLLIFRKIRI